MFELSTVIGVLIPFAGTVAGSGVVYFLKKEMNIKIEKGLLGFASGVMMAASVWSLLIPSLEMSDSQGMGKLSIIPCGVGFAAGILLLLLLDKLIPHLHFGADKPEGLHASLKKTTMMALAVALHNLPEGMAVGVVFAGLQEGKDITLMSAFALSIGIAIQNFPEGAIISMPLFTQGLSRNKSFVYGVLSGVVEVAGAVFTILLSQIFMTILPYLLSFAAGAMVYVIVEELIPEANQGEHSNIGTIGFAVGFLLMMVLDVTFG